MQGKPITPKILRTICQELASGNKVTEVATKYDLGRTVVARIKRTLELQGLLTSLAIGTKSDEALCRMFYPGCHLVRVSDDECFLQISRNDEAEYLPVDAEGYAQIILDSKCQVQDLYCKYIKLCAEQGKQPVCRGHFYKLIQTAKENLTRGDDAVLLLHFDFGKSVQIDYIGELVSLTMQDYTKQDFNVFTMTWPASYYTFAIFIPSQSTQQTCWAVGEGFKYFGCYPDCIVPDNAKSMVVSHPRGREAVINKSFAYFMSCLGIAVEPTAAYSASSKSAVEYSNRLIKERIYRHIDRETPKTLRQHNIDLMKLVEEKLNCTRLRKTGMTRQQIFDLYEKPKAHQLVSETQIPEYEEVLAKRKLPRNYHLTIYGHSYSVPYIHIGLDIIPHVTADTVKFYSVNGRLLSQFPRRDGDGQSTLPEHMPVKHRMIIDSKLHFSTDEDILIYADSISGSLYRLCELRLARKDSQRFKACEAMIKFYYKAPDTSLMELAVWELLIHPELYPDFGSGTLIDIYKKFQRGELKSQTGHESDADDGYDPEEDSFVHGPDWLS